ncbi:hypothetical protein DFH29DRAFT_879302 [Suillus ampliporus]|nr:hypothetical protein DFH29DRAFT_879302 [Suillus ampliporus]
MSAKCSATLTLAPPENDIINLLPSARQRTGAQTAAFLLGIHPHLPDVNDNEINTMCSVQLFYKEMPDKPPVNDHLTALESYQAPVLKKVEFRVPLHTMDPDQLTTYVDQFYSESESCLDIFEAVKATMNVTKAYKHLGWRLSTTCHTDPPHQLLTWHDINSGFKATRAEQGSGRRTKKVAIEIINTMPVLKGKPTSKQKAGERQSLSLALLPYVKEFEHVKSKLRCFEHREENTFCWVDGIQPNAQHYLMCVQDLQEWAKYLHKMGDLDTACVTLPNTPHFDELQKTHKGQTMISLQRVPTELISPVIHNHIHLSPAINDTTISDDTLTGQQGEHPMPPQPLKRMFALYMESDEESDDNELLQVIEDVLYLNKMKNCGILYLPTAAHFHVRFYEEKVGMPKGTAYSFQNYVSIAQTKVKCVKARRKAKGKKKARIQHDSNKDEGNISVRPTTRVAAKLQPIIKVEFKTTVV